MSVLTFDNDKELDKFLAVGCPHCKKDLTGVKWPAKGDICKACWADAGVELVVNGEGTGA